MATLFFAGLDTYEYLRFLPWSANIRHIGVSYADFLPETGGEKYFYEGKDLYQLFNPDHRVWLDSGGFSAFKTGYNITVEMFAGFLEKYQDQFYTVASLDDKTSQRKTYENYHWLRKRGFVVGPVWSAIGGDMGHLREYMSDPDVPIVFIGAIAKEKDADNNFFVRRFNEIFSLVGTYKKPVHALGRTDPQVMFRYPFASADSLTWQNSGRYGLVLKWLPVDRRLINVKIRKPKDMERAFGPRAKVLMGQLHDKHDRPLYHVQTAQNIEETLKEEEALNTFWERRGVTWDEDAIDFRKRLPSGMIEDCRANRATVGIALPGDPNYEPGYLCKYLLHRRNWRINRKWEAERDETELAETTWDILQETEFKERILHLAKT